MSTNQDAPILLLGGAGFMGRALSARLRERGSIVHVVTRDNEVREDGGVMHSGGIENTELLRKLIPQCPTVIHMASATTPGLSSRAPSLESRNIAPTLGLIEILQDHPHVRVIYISSGGTVYGNPTLSAVPEHAEIQPLSFYGAGKAALETFLRCLQQTGGNPVTILRPSNVYGPHQPMYRGFGVIRTMLQHLRNDTAMTIWGDGSVVRDFLYIDDMVSAVECVLDDAGATGTLNVGSGDGHSLNEIIRIMEAVCGARLRVQYEPSRGIDVQRVVLDISTIKARYGWDPTVSIENGLARTWEWLCSQ